MIYLQKDSTAEYFDIKPAIRKLKAEKAILERSSRGTFDKKISYRNVIGIVGRDEYAFDTLTSSIDCYLDEFKELQNYTEVRETDKLALIGGTSMKEKVDLRLWKNEIFNLKDLQIHEGISSVSVFLCVTDDVQDIYDLREMVDQMIVLPTATEEGRKAFIGHMWSRLNVDATLDSSLPPLTDELSKLLVAASKNCTLREINQWICQAIVSWEKFKLEEQINGTPIKGILPEATLLSRLYNENGYYCMVPKDVNLISRDMVSASQTQPRKNVDIEFFRKEVSNPGSKRKRKENSVQEDESMNKKIKGWGC